MDYLADVLGILGVALLLTKFIAARHERQVIYGQPSWTTNGIRVSHLPVRTVEPLDCRSPRRQPKG